MKVQTYGNMTLYFGNDIFLYILFFNWKLYKPGVNFTAIVLYWVKGNEVNFKNPPARSVSDVIRIV